MSASRAAPRVSSGGLAALVIAAIAAVEIALVAVVLNPRTFFSSDPGVKYLQAEALLSSGWRQLSVPDPAASVDPEGRFSPFVVNQFGRRDSGTPWYGAYSEIFTIPVSLALAWLGLRGLYLVPLLAGVGTMILTYRLSARSAPQLAWLAPLLVGACSPMLFYSVDLWEHTLATLFATAAIWFIVSAGEGNAVRRFALAGLASGLAIAVREELYAVIPAGLVALAWLHPARRLRAALAAAAAALLVLVPFVFLKFGQVSRPANRAIIHVFGYGEDTLSLGGQVPAPMRAALGLIVPPAPVWFAALLLIIAGRLLLMRLSARGRSVVAGSLATAVAAWATIAMLRAWAWIPPASLLNAFPPALLLIFLVSPRRAPPREIGQLLAIALTFLVVFCVAVQFTTASSPAGGSQWGPRFLLPVIPPLAVLIVWTLAARGEWRSRGLSPESVAATFAIVVVASLLVQVQGIRALHSAKRQYERLAAMTETIAADQVLVSDIWWYPMTTAAVLRLHPVVAVQGRHAAPLEELLPLLRERDVRRVTFVTPAPADGAAARAFAAAGWREARRTSVQAWLEVLFVEYRRDDGAASAATL